MLFRTSRSSHFTVLDTGRGLFCRCITRDKGSSRIDDRACNRERYLFFVLHSYTSSYTVCNITFVIIIGYSQWHSLFLYFKKLYDI